VTTLLTKQGEDLFKARLNQAQAELTAEGLGIPVEEVTPLVLQAYLTGLARSWNEGRKQGLKERADEAYENEGAAYQRGFDAAASRGDYDKGYTEGYQAGEEAGYEKGYEKGMDDGYWCYAFRD
jgi:hypothetical protein